MPLFPGQVLNNRYRIVKLLGQGGFGAVYRAWEMNLERPLALKENLDTSSEAQRQFKREAQILFDLSHPNLPKVIDYFTILGQGQYLVMEFVEGEDLGQKQQCIGGPLPEAQALPWIVQICEALAYLHAQNPPVIHRDIKPANIKITSSGKAMLVDFGIAKVYDPHLSTTVGARAVTPGYSPIEQYGRSSHTDPRTDVYALGATLYTLLTGQEPVDAPERNLGKPVPAPNALNPGISAVASAAVMRAIEILPEQRFQSINEFKLALQALPQPPQLRANAVSPVQTVVMPAQAAVPSHQLKVTSAQPGLSRFPWLRVGGIVGLLAVGVLICGLAFFNNFLLDAAQKLFFAPALSTSTATPTIRPAATRTQPTTSVPPIVPTPTATPTETPHTVVGDDWICGRLGLDTIRIDNLSSLELLDEITEINLSGYYGIAFSPEGQFIAGFVDNDVKVWDIAANQIISTLSAHTQLVRSIAFSPDGRLLATGGEDLRINVWKFQESVLIAQFDMTYWFPGTLAFMPDSRVLASGNGTTQFWDVGTAQSQPLQTYPDAGYTWLFSFLDGGQRAIVFAGATGEQYRIKVMNVDDWSVALEFEGDPGGGWWQYSQAGNFLAVAAEDYTLLVWDVYSGALLYELKNTGTAVEIDPKGMYLVASFAENSFGFWELSTGRELYSLPVGESHIAHIAISKNGCLLATTSPGAVHLWGVRK